MITLDFNQLTAFGTLLTGIAAIAAVFGGFVTMRSQMKKSNTMAWLTSFRTIYVEFCLQVAKVSEDMSNDQIYELQRLGLTLRLLLSSKNKVQQELNEEFKEFWKFVKRLNFTDQEFEEHLHKLHSLVEKVISETESTL